MIIDKTIDKTKNDEIRWKELWVLRVAILCNDSIIKLSIDCICEVENWLTALECLSLNVWIDE